MDKVDALIIFGLVVSCGLIGTSVANPFDSYVGELACNIIGSSGLAISAMALMARYYKHHGALDEVELMNMEADEKGIALSHPSMLSIVRINIATPQDNLIQIPAEQLA